MWWLDEAHPTTDSSSPCLWLVVLCCIFPRCSHSETAFCSILICLERITVNSIQTSSRLSEKNRCVWSAAGCKSFFLELFNIENPDLLKVKQIQRSQEQCIKINLFLRLHKHANTSSRLFGYHSNTNLVAESFYEHSAEERLFAYEIV